MSEQKIGRQLAPRLAIEKWIRENDTTVTSPEDMMLGRVDPQGSLFEPEHLSGDLVTRGSSTTSWRPAATSSSATTTSALYAANQGRPSIMIRGLLLA